MRVCHLDTCPVGVATQNPELRRRFSGKPEFVETFFEYIAEEVRDLLARLGFRSIAEAVGHVELIDTRAAVDHWKASGLDLAPILAVPDNPYGQTFLQSVPQDHGLDHALDQTLLQLCEGAIADARPVRLEIPIRNVNRTVGTMLGNAVTKAWGGEGLPDGTIDVAFRGSAGQSFGAFLPPGITLRLEGDANDYFGKGLSGGRVVVHPDREARIAAEENIIAGNVALYGATAGEAFISGVVGERFCVRNSGALAVVEGVGDHGCEYMTGGTAVVLGPTGRNFGAGMSGGVAYVYDPDGRFPGLVNTEMVELEPLDGADRDTVREIVTRHRELTGSHLAARLLDSWSTTEAAFRKVMPLDYRRVKHVMEEAKAKGLGEDETLAQVMAASHG
jgi:glutamate synthase (NADPH/NADH) large chain